jgi:glycosyltransferase involved in cell wall biosynthesis
MQRQMAAEQPAFNVIICAQGEWDLVWIFSHDLAQYFISAGHTVIYLNPFPKRLPRLGEWRRLVARLFQRPQLLNTRGQQRPKGMKLLTPVCLPDTCKIFSFINRKWLLPKLCQKTLRLLKTGQSLIVFNFLPFATPVTFALGLYPDLLIYAQRSGWPDDPASRKTQSREKELLAAAELVITSSPILSIKAQQQQMKLLEIPALVDFELYYRPVSAAKIKKPVCCFLGNPNERIAVELLLGIAAQFKLCIIGLLAKGSVLQAAPIEQWGLVDQNELPELISKVDVFIFPYKLNEFTNNIFPYKIFQCFAQGKAIVSSRLPSMSKLGDLVYWADDLPAFLQMIETAAGEGCEIKVRRQELARQYDRSVQLAEVEARLRQQLLIKENHNQMPGTKPG